MGVPLRGGDDAVRQKLGWTNSAGSDWYRFRSSQMLLDHFDGILNYCRTKVALGVVEAINGNIKSLLRRGRGTRTYTICC